MVMLVILRFPPPRDNIGTSQGMGPSQPLLPYMVNLSLLDLNQRINYPLHRYSSWPPISTKLPSYIPNLKGILERIPPSMFVHFTYGTSLILSQSIQSVYAFSNALSPKLLQNGM